MDKCEWVLYSYPLMGKCSRKLIPTSIRWTVSRYFKKVHRCDKPGIYVINSTIDVYDGLKVCEKHKRDIFMSERIREMLDNGEL